MSKFEPEVVALLEMKGPLKKRIEELGIKVHDGGISRDLLMKITESIADITTIVSKEAARQFISRKVIPEEKLQVIYNGLDHDNYFSGLSKTEKNEIRKWLKLPAEGYLLLCVGRLSKQKGYSDLLEAFSILVQKRSDIYLAIAGEVWGCGL